MEREASDYFVHPEIGNFLLDDMRFSNALQWYRSAGFCSSPAADPFRHHLPADVPLFWSYTAMVLTFLAATSTDCLVPAEYRSSRDTARHHWLEAVKLITGMTQNEGHSSLVLHTSLIHLLSYFDDAASQQVREQTKSTIEQAQLGKSDRSVKYWIPGLMNWKEKLAQAWPPIDGRSKL